MDRPLANSYWVLPGSLLAGENPYATAEADTRQRLQRLLDAGINVFIDLTQPGERPDYHGFLPAHVDYLRMPIPDAAVPADFAQMRDIQSRLQSALAVGRRIYVHCRAGIGRTGTVIGCYLTEQGLDGEAALSQLNRLWKQSARSVSWPSVPQTPEQAQFVRGWPQHRQSDEDGAALAAMRSLRHRFLGCLTGLAIGDALGVSAQFGKPGTFPPVSDFRGGGPFDLPAGHWSDDTALALCLAQSLLETSSFDVADQVSRYLAWQSEGRLAADAQCIGITAGTAHALARARQEGMLRASHADNHEAAPLARVAPVVLFYFAHEGRAIERAAAAARVFDASPLVCDTCRLLAAMLHAALRGEPLARVLSPPATLFGERPLMSPVLALCREDPSLSQPPAHAEPALAALAAARWAIAGGGSFRGGVLRAANLGGNSDVIAAVQGQLAGAVYGLPVIPASWRLGLAQAELLQEFADRLLTAALVGLSEVSL